MLRTNSKEYLFSSPVGLLFLILLLKITVTLCTVFVYAKYSPFPDAERYLRAQLNTWDFSLLFNRTLFTDFVYALLKQILVFNTAVHLFISAVLGVVLWFVLKDDYEFINKPLLCGCLFLPHFLIWSGIVGKEALAIAGFLLFVKACVDLVIWNKLKIAPLLLGIFLGIIERPHYALAYIYLYVISLLITKSKVQFMGLFSPRKSRLILLVVLGYCSVLYYQLQVLVSHPMSQFMLSAQQYFLRYFSSSGNRWNIVWSHANDFFINLPWGLPIGIIGPTSTEAMARPFLFPVFIEGCIAFFLVLVLCYKLFRLLKRHPNFNTLIIWGFIPATILGLLINYPIGIFNPGSAIRYKQSLAPLLYFYPLLLMGAIQRKSYLEKE